MDSASNILDRVRDILDTKIPIDIDVSHFNFEQWAVLILGVCGLFIVFVGFVTKN